MSRNGLILWILALVGATSQAATAAPLQLGNVAPGSGEMQLYVNGALFGPALDYAGFAEVQRGDGPLAVVARRHGTDEVLASATLELHSDPRIQPLLVLTGNGSTAPYTLRLYQFPGDESHPDAKALENSGVALHHLAPMAASDAEAIPMQLTCSGVGNTPGSSTFTSHLALHYGQARTQPLLSGFDDWSCELQLSDDPFGNFTVSGPLHNDRTTRFLLIGDGAVEPFQVAVAQGTGVVDVFDPAQPEPVTLPASSDIWYDTGRPAQAITLYEIPGGADTLGFWFTHDGSGRPTWFFLDGVATGLPGQRDLVVYRGTPGGAEPLDAVGSARLFYLDCNNAELRILSGERRFDTLRLRRSRPVGACEALN